MVSANQATPLVDQSIEYNVDSALLTKAPNSAAFFTNPFENHCGLINSCSLKLAGCSTDYTDTNLVIDAVSGAITAKQNVDAGYVDIVCIKCLNTAGSFITHDNWTVT